MSTTVDPTTTTTPAPTSPMTATMENMLILDLFLPPREGAWSPSSAYEFNARCAIGATKYGFDPRLFGERVVPLMVEAGPRKPGD